MTNEAIEAAALLPCPFCGAFGSLFDSPDHSTAWEGGCSVEGCPGFDAIWKETKAEAIAAWNTRAAAPVLMEEGARLALEAAAEVVDDREFQAFIRALDPAAIVKGAGRDRD